MAHLILTLCDALDILSLVKRGVRRMLPLTFGWEHIPRRTSMPLVPEAEGRVFLREPVPGLLLETQDGYVLLDTGFNGALVRDRAFYHCRGLAIPWRTPSPTWASTRGTSWRWR